jgi:DNA-binding Lrp family transcriptional regulator
MQLDLTDLKILAQLQEDSSLTNVELARRVASLALSLSTKGQSTGGCASDQAVCGLGRSSGLRDWVVCFYLHQPARKQAKAALADFESRIAEHDEVMECYLMTGDCDYLIRVAVRDIGALERFILEQLTPIPGIEKIRSSFALKQVRYKTALPLPSSVAKV